MNIICQSIYYQYVLDKFHLFKSPTTFRVIITIILCYPCYMPKYVPRLEGLLTLGHIYINVKDSIFTLVCLYAPNCKITNKYFL